MYYTFKKYQSTENLYFDHKLQILLGFGETIAFLCEGISKIYAKIWAARKVYISTVNHKKSWILPIFNKIMYLHRKTILTLKNISPEKSSYFDN